MTLEADLAAASDPSTPAEVLVCLSKSRSPRVRRAVAENVASPKEALARLFKKFPDLVLSNPASALFNMEPGGTWEWIPLAARQAAAENKSTSVIILEALASDASWSVRFRVSKNAMTPVSILEALASDADSNVRSGVARNERTPAVVLKALAFDTHWFVRGGVAENARTPISVLKVLTSDVDGNVRVAAKARLP